MIDGIIYTYTNQFTNRVYVGSTETTLKERQNGRKKRYKQWLRGIKYSDNHKLFNDIFEYGWESFVLKEIWR